MKDGVFYLLARSMWAIMRKKDIYRCPRCNYPIFEKREYCFNCGQPFKWGENEKL